MNGERLERLRRSLEVALQQEWPELERTRRHLALLQPSVIRQLDRPSMTALGTVATDGGENRLNLDPIQLQVVRVADSRGEIHFEEFVALSSDAKNLMQWFSETNPRVQGLLRYLELGWEDLMPKTDFQKGNMLSMVRELMEWGALLKLASRGPPRLLIRDGLLRTVLLTEKTFCRLAAKFEVLATRHGHFLAGVAKRSQVINYLSLALNLQESFGGGEPSWIAIPPEIERQAAPAQYRWIGARAMGALHIARLDRGGTVPLLPVDIAAWQGHRVDEIMSLLHESSRGSFPARGYPLALSQAHEHARLDQLQIKILERLLLEELSRRAPEVAREVRQQRLRGRPLLEDENEPPGKF
jgi:hypothetical protein